MYQGLALWAWLEIVFTPKRYKDPVLWAWLEKVLTIRDTNSITTH